MPGNQRLRATWLVVAVLAGYFLGSLASNLLLGREAHDWIAKPKRHAAAFNYYARQNLRQHADCLN